MPRHGKNNSTPFQRGLHARIENNDHTTFEMTSFHLTWASDWLGTYDMGASSIFSTIVTTVVHWNSKRNWSMTALRSTSDSNHCILTLWCHVSFCIRVQVPNDRVVLLCSWICWILKFTTCVYVITCITRRPSSWVAVGILWYPHLIYGIEEAVLRKVLVLPR